MHQLRSSDVRARGPRYAAPGSERKVSHSSSGNFYNSNTKKRFQGRIVIEQLTVPLNGEIRFGTPKDIAR